VAASDVALVGEEQVTAQRVQALALVQLPPDSPTEFLVSDVSAEVGGVVDRRLTGALKVSPNSRIIIK
jgi:hypothetical protein